MKKFLDSLICNYPIDGLFFAIENNSLSSNSYAFLLLKQSETSMDDFFDDQNENQYKEWYHKTLDGKQSWWINPVFNEEFGARITGCCVPFCLENKEKGIIIVIYNTTHIYERLQQFGLSRYGLPYIMDSSTVFVAHPLDETRSLGELGYEYYDPVLVRLANDLIIRKKLEDNYIHPNTVTGQFCNEKFASIDETGWFMGLSVYDGCSLESEAYRLSMKRCLIRILLLSALWIIIGIFLVNKWLKKPIRFQYLLSLIFFGVIVGTISAYNRFPVKNYSINESNSDAIFEQIKINTEEQDFLNNNRIYNKWAPQRIVDPKSLDNFLERYKQESKKLYDEPVKIIPTGLYIHSVQFANSYEVRVSGTIWQKFLMSGNDIPENIALLYHTDEYTKKGILFPGAQVNEYVQTDSIPILINNCKAVLYRWNFDINIPQQLSYSLFPFGKNEIIFPLWSTDLDDNTVLIPDLSAYKQIYPDICPGLGNHFEINGWDILNTYYSYSMESYLCNFGNTDIYGINRFPELLYNISVSRKFIDSLVCKIIPIAVVLVLLFTILFVRNDADGFNNIIGCSGLFFVLVFDHINLRETVLSEGIMYLEYCYFFTYLLLLLITVTSFQLENNIKAKQFLEWTDIILKRYFWSFVFGFIATTTLFVFY
ncbi:MAG: cache domain-containing protein [Bacteroidales bacterium]|jgi:hypothetical protein|nr:cache domain-containing protein [Bacteroidales bacterium]